MKTKKWMIQLLMIGISIFYLMQCQKSDQDSDHPHSHDNDSAAHAPHESEQQQVEDNHNHDSHLEDNLESHNHTEHNHGTFIPADESWESLIGLKTAPVEKRTLDNTLSVPGKIISNPDHKAVISPFIEASVNQVFVKDGDYVKKGDILACLTSPDLGISRAEYDKSKAELDIEKQQFKRKQDLFNEKIISKKTFEDARLQLKKVEVNYNFTRSRLLALGIPENEIDNPSHEHSETAGSNLHITTPIDGIVTYRNTSMGQKVNAGTVLFEIMNLDIVWLEADIFDKDLLKVKEGQTVKLALTNGNSQILKGQIFHIGNRVDEKKRTIHVLAEIKNKEHKLKLGMFINAHIVLEHQENTLVIPGSAILNEAGVRYVFVKEEGGYFQHPIQTGIVDGEFVEVIEGLENNDQIVVQGNYQLKSKSRMSDLDPHAGHVH